MALVPVTGGCNTSYNAGDSFLNYGAISSAPLPLASYPINFVLPYDGYVKYASIALNQIPSVNSSYTIHNLDTAQSASGILSVNNAEQKAYIELDDTVLAFSAGDRLVWSSDNNITSTSTVLTTYVELDVDKKFLCITASLDGGFTTGTNPFSYGAGAHNDVGGSIEQHIPINTYFRGVGISANVAGAVVPSEAAFGIYNNITQVQEISVEAPNLSTFFVDGGTIAFNKGARLFLNAESTVANLNATVVLLFEINDLP